MNRVDYLDNAKFFAIILMVLGHCTIKNQIPGMGALIYSFHMPLFFVISGYLFKPNLPKEAFRKYANTCLRPYAITMLFALVLISVIYTLVLSELSFTNTCVDFFKRMVWGSANFISGSIWGDVPRSMALWFLPAMFWGLLFLTFIDKYIPNMVQKILIVFLVFVLSCISITRVRMPLAIQQGGGALLYLFVGYTIKQYGKMDYIFNVTPLTKVLAVLIWMPCIYLGGVSMGECNYGGGISVIKIAGSLAGVYCFLLLCKTVIKGHIKLGRYTLYVMLGQSIVQFFLDYNDNYIINGYSFNVFENLCLNFLGTALFAILLNFIVAKTQFRLSIRNTENSGCKQ